MFAASQQGLTSTPVCRGSPEHVLLSTKCLFTMKLEEVVIFGCATFVTIIVSHRVMNRYQVYNSILVDFM